jgi:hypothetical protein
MINDLVLVKRLMLHLDLSQLLNTDPFRLPRIVVSELALELNLQLLLLRDLLGLFHHSYLADLSLLYALLDPLLNLLASAVLLL